MHTPQTIVVIGAGEIGKGIVRGLSGGRDRVVFCDRDFDAATSFTEELQKQHSNGNVEALQCSYEATWEADIIILSLPSCPDRLEMAKKIKAVASQKIVIVADETAVKELQALLPYSKVVQAFDGLPAGAFDGTAEQKKQIYCPVKGEDAEAVQAVAALVRTIGFTAVATLSNTNRMAV